MSKKKDKGIIEEKKSCREDKKKIILVQEKRITRNSATKDQDDDSEKDVKKKYDKKTDEEGKKEVDERKCKQSKKKEEKNTEDITRDRTLKKNVSSNKLYLGKWLASGKTIPICINEGCESTVTIRHWSVQGDPSLKTECSRCSEARKCGKILTKITFHKKKFCENNTGILGFICPMDKLRYEEFPSDIYHMDHVDGDHHNNTAINVKTFCSICHTRKGRDKDDFNPHKNSSRLHKSKS
jgi:hypothetical protein